MKGRITQLLLCVSLLFMSVQLVAEKKEPENPELEWQKNPLYEPPSQKKKEPEKSKLEWQTSPLYAKELGYYDIINKGLTTIDPGFTQKYSYPLNEKSSQVSVNAACNRQQTYIIQELKKAKTATQERKQLLDDQNEMNTVCEVLTNPTSRAAHAKEEGKFEAKKREEEEKRKEQEELERLKKVDPQAYKAKLKEIKEREEAKKKSERPQPGDPDYIPGMNGYLGNMFEENQAKISDLIGEQLSKIDIPSAALKLFNNDLVLKDMRFLKAPVGPNILMGLGFTGTTQFNNFSVKASVYIVRDSAKKIQYSLAIELPDNYKISTMFPNFKKLDVLSLPKGQLVVSTFKYVDANGYAIEMGFNFVASLKLDGPLRALGELRKKAKAFDAIVFDFEAPVYLHGVISSLTTAAVSFEAVVPLRLGIDFTKVKHFPKGFSTIIKKITTDDIKIGVSITPLEQKLTAQTGIQIILGSKQKPFRIQAFGGVDVTSGKVNFGGKMPDMLELKFIAIGDTKIEFYLDPAVESILIFFGVPVSGVALGGRIDLGKKGKTRVSLSANGKLSLEAKKLADFVMEVEGKNIQFAEIVSLLTKMAAKSGIKGAVIPASKLPVMTINRVYGKIAPWDTEIANEKIAAGFQLVLDAQLFDTKFGLDIDIKHKDLVFAGSGYMSEVVFKSGKNTIFKLSGPGPDRQYGTPDDGPIVSCSFNAKKPLEGSFKVATMLDVPPIGLKQTIDLEIEAKKFKADFETSFLGFTVVFGIDIDPAKWKEMYIRFGFKGDFAGFLSKQARPAIESLKKKATAKLAKVDKKIGELAGELNKLKRDQTRIKQQGVKATQQEINKTKATISRINGKIRSLKEKCKNAAPYRKVDVCAAAGIEIIAQGTALAAQETYLNALLKPGKQVIKGTMEALNTINKSMQIVSTGLSTAKILQKSVGGVLGGVSKAIAGIAKGLDIFKVSEAIGEVSAKDFAEGKLPKLISFKAEINIPEVAKVKVDLSNIQFDFKNPIDSALDIAEQLVSSIKI